MASKFALGQAGRVALQGNGAQARERGFGTQQGSTVCEDSIRPVSRQQGASGEAGCNCW